MKLTGIILGILNFLLVEGILQTKDLTIVILSQQNKYNSQIAKNLKLNICEQALALRQVCSQIYLSHEEFSHIGEWTIVPILPKLAELAKDSSWIVFIEDRTAIRIKPLLEALSKYDINKDLWIGYSLQDDQPTIIHHFHEKELSYPHLGAGFAMTNHLLQNVSKTLSIESTDFNIDKAFEFALFLGNKSLLIHDDFFCVNGNIESCAAFPIPFEACETSSLVDSIYFAVKTCSKFHHDRVPVVLNTWAKVVNRIGFFSDVEDEAIPTINLGVPNVESGHCEKTMQIFKYLNKKFEHDNSVKWIVVADDDTIISVSRMLELVSCYDPQDDVALGERYGYGVYNPLGFNYITGGGGMVFSKTLLRKLVSSCKCPTISAPDDMVLGHCIAQLGVKVTHSHLFHQARPVDYSPDFLKSDRPVSFHKHWMSNPIEVYNQWFAKDDMKLAKNINTKTEL